jgi:hypothetical protein
MSTPEEPMTREELRKEFINELSTLIDPVWVSYMEDTETNDFESLRAYFAAASKLGQPFIKQMLTIELEYIVEGKVLPLPSPVTDLLCAVRRSDGETLQLTAYLHVLGMKWVDIEFWLQIWEGASGPLSSIVWNDFKIGYTDDQTKSRLKDLVEYGCSCPRVNARWSARWDYACTVATHWRGIMEAKAKYLNGV